MRITRLLAGIAVLGFIAVGCSDDKKSSQTSPETTAAAADTTVADTTPLTNPDPVVIELAAGAITIEQTTFAAGTINFEATNVEELPHVFAIAKGAFADLPTTGNGAIDAAALGADLLAKTGLLMPGLGTTKVVTVDLEPGTYVIYCNGGDDESKGEVSHVSAGEYVEITVV